MHYLHISRLGAFLLVTCPQQGEEKMDYESNYGEDPMIFLDSTLLDYPTSIKLDIYFDL